MYGYILSFPRNKIRIRLTHPKLTISIETYSFYYFERKSEAYRTSVSVWLTGYTSISILSTVEILIDDKVSLGN